MHTRTLLIAGILLAAASAHAQSQKPVVGIAPIHAEAQNISCEGWEIASGFDCTQSLTKGFRTMLETAIVKSRKMDVMERVRMDTILEEQLLGQVDLTTSGGEIGNLIGIDYMIYGAITKFGVREEGFAVGNGVTSLLDDRLAGIVGSVASSSATTEMAVDIKVTDVANGTIVLADTVEGVAEQGKAIQAGGVRIAEGTGDPFADVQRVVAQRLAEAVVTSRIPIKVIQVQGDGTLILNYGNVFLSPGDTLALFDVGEQFVDPDTGEILGSEETQVGEVQVVAAETKFSKARVVEADRPVAAGAVLRRIQVIADAKPRERQRSGGRF